MTKLSGWLRHCVQVPDKAVNASDKINRSNIHTNDTISL